MQKNPVLLTNMRADYERTEEIVVSCCENSAYKAAQAVQDSDISESMNLVRLSCAGKIEIGLVLKCFEQRRQGC